MPKYADDGGASLYPRIERARHGREPVHRPLEPGSTDDDPGAGVPRPLAPGRRARRASASSSTSTRRTARRFAVDPDARTALFAAYLQSSRARYPQVTDFIVGNEPNESYFWRPQFGPAGEQVVGARRSSTLLAASYDALKAVDPAIRVIAGRPLERGATTGTVDLAGALPAGARRRLPGERPRRRRSWTRSAFHVYPRDEQPIAPSKHYAWPNAGGADLARIKQAVWDAFDGTGPADVRRGPGGLATAAGSRLVVDEFGWQVAIDAGARRPLHGRGERADDHARPSRPVNYRELIGMLACDPAVTDALVFHLVDERDLDRFQSGLLRAEPQRAAVVRRRARRQSRRPGAAPRP